MDVCMLGEYARMVVQINVRVDDEQHAELVARKGDRTWLEVLEDGAEVES